MTNARKSLGWAAVVLGWLGVALCLGGLVLVWLTSHRTRASVDRVAAKVIGITSELHARSVEAKDWVGESQREVIALEGELDSALSGALEESGIEPARLRAMTEQLRELSVKVGHWAAAAESIPDLVELFVEVLESLGVVIGASGKEELRTALASGLGKVGETTEALEQLAGALRAAQAEVEFTPASYQPLLQRFAESLGRLMLTTTAFAEGVAAVEEETEGLRDGVGRRLWLWTLLATALLIWGAIGQYALAGWGRRSLAGGQGS